MAHTQKHRGQLIARIRRIAGQVAAIERALDSDEGCAAVLQQAAAARGAINGLMDALIEEHLREHVANPDLADTARQEGAEELLAVIRRYAK